MKTKAAGLHPFVPSGSDFAEALRFFETIGFTREWGDDDLTGLRYGDAYFLLQNIDVPTWQSNQMIILEVDDLDQYWAELSALNLPESFSGVRIKEPTDYAWGRELHIIDPAGVCWHVRQTN